MMCQEGAEYTHNLADPNEAAERAHEAILRPTPSTHVDPTAPTNLPLKKALLALAQIHLSVQIHLPHARRGAANDQTSFTAKHAAQTAPDCRKES